MINSNELFYGKAFTESLEAFKSELSQVETKYEEYFSQRPPKYANQKHDILSNHYFMQWDNGSIRFTFLPDSDLMRDIQEECVKVFNRRFGNK
jgi:hypothetical protein